MLRVFAIGICAACLFSIAAAGETSPHEPSIQDLDVLIGKWRYVDQSTELAGFDYRETGTTECAYALDDAYIRCDGEGVFNGKSRTFGDTLQLSFTWVYQCIF